MKRYVVNETHLDVIEAARDAGCNMPGSYHHIINDTATIWFCCDSDDIWHYMENGEDYITNDVSREAFYFVEMLYARAMKYLNRGG